MKPAIYVIRHEASGRVYIGSARVPARRFAEHRSRLRRGVHTNARLQAAWNKHGEAAFTFELLASVLDVAHIEAVEQQALDQWDAVRTGYNLAPTAGNTAGWRATEETRRRMSDAAKRRDHAAQVQAMAARNRGQRRPAHVVEAMQAGRRAKPLTAESRARMAAAALARSPYTPEQARKMAELHAAGMSLRSISRAVGLARPSVTRYIERFKAEA